MTAPVTSAPTAALDKAPQPSPRAQIEKAAQQFEGLFMSMMLKSMRGAQDALGTGLFDSAATRQFRDMQDDKLAVELGSRGTLGIAKAMADFIERTRPDLVGEEPK
jgi:flagellar protein FlgJ